MIYENSADLKHSINNKLNQESEEEYDNDETPWDDDFPDTEEEDEEINGKLSHTLIIQKPLPPEPVGDFYEVPPNFEEVRTVKKNFIGDASLKSKPSLKPKMEAPEVKQKNSTTLPVSFNEDLNRVAPISGESFMKQLSFRLNSKTSIERFMNRPLPVCPNEEENYEICEHQEQTSDNQDENYEICDQQVTQPPPKTFPPKPVTKKVTSPISNMPTFEKKINEEEKKKKIKKEESYNYIPPDIIQTFSQVPPPQKVELPPPDVYEFPDVPPPIVKRDNKQNNINLAGSNQTPNTPNHDRDSTKSKKGETLQKQVSKTGPLEKKNPDEKNSSNASSVNSGPKEMIQKSKNLVEGSSVKPILAGKKMPPEIKSKKPELPSFNKDSGNNQVTGELFKKQLSVTLLNPPTKSHTLPVCLNTESLQENLNQNNDTELEENYEICNEIRDDICDENYEVCDQQNVLQSQGKPVTKDIIPPKPMDIKPRPTNIPNISSNSSGYILPNTPIFFTPVPQRISKDPPPDVSLSANFPIAPPVVKRDAKKQNNAENEPANRANSKKELTQKEDSKVIPSKLISSPRSNVPLPPAPQVQLPATPKAPLSAVPQLPPAATTKAPLSAAPQILLPSTQTPQPVAPQLPLAENNKTDNQIINVPGKPKIPERSFQKPIVSKVNTISEKLWYHGEISREVSVKLLKTWNKESAFLVRTSNKGDGYSLSIFHKGNVTHLRISSKDNFFYLGTSEKPFKSVEDLIKFYQTNLLSLISGGEICLTTTPPRIKNMK